MRKGPQETATARLESIHEQRRRPHNQDNNAKDRSQPAALNSQEQRDGETDLIGPPRPLAEPESEQDDGDDGHAGLLGPQQDAAGNVTR